MRLFSCSAIFAVVLSTAALSQGIAPVQQNNSNTIWFENWTGLSNGTMKITIPGGELVEVFAASGTPVFELSGREIVDGIYRYELSAATKNERKILNSVNNGRGDAARDSQSEPFYLSGAFHVSRGVIVQPEQIKEE